MSGAALPIPPPSAEPVRATLAGLVALRARVVGALILREMQTRFGRSNFGFLWLFFEPLFLGLMIGLIHSLHSRRLPGGVDPIYFSIIGYVPFFMFRAIVTRAGAAIHSNLTLLFHRQVTPFDVVLARNLLEAAAVCGVVLLIIVIGSWALGELPHAPGLVFVALFFSFWLAHGLAMLVAAACAEWPGAERLIHPFTYILMPFSGAFYSLDWMSPQFREVLLWNPIAHVHEAIREGIFGDRIVTHFDFGYVAVWILVVNLLGLAALRSARRKLDVF